MWKTRRQTLLMTFVLATTMAGRLLAVGTDQVDTGQGDIVLREVMMRLQSDVLAYRNAVESAYDNRCSSSTMNTCQKNNYNECTSQYPNQTCPSADHAVISACGKGELCNGLFDWSVSTVRLPKSLAKGPQGNPTDPQIIETICYSRRTDDFLKNMFSTSDSFWEKHGMPYHPMMYFGASDGAFRIFPARQSVSCGAYDPRNRPWYQAAVPWLISESSNGRDVVLVVDNSKSVGEDGRLGLFQNALKSIISSLTIYDRIALIFFNEDARVAGDYESLVNGTDKMKEELKKAIDNMKTRGRTNYKAGFLEAFSVLKNSAASGNGPKCNTAIVFIADQPTNYPAGVGAKDIISIVEEEMAEFPQANKTQIFTYSAQNNKQVREISCGIDAVWSGMTNSTKAEDLISNYHSFFALGLGQEVNINFTAWVGPYRFSTGGIRGITSSALVYDRTINPPLFIGAVGADLTMDKIEQVLGYGGTEADETLKRVMETFNQTPTVICPINLEGCGLEAARYFSGGYVAMCDMSCENATGVLPKLCSGEDEFPDNLWQNTKLEGEPFEDRVCCRIGDNVTSNQCPNIDLYGEPKLTNMEIFGIILGAVVACEIVACIYWQTGFRFMKCKKEKPGA